MIFLRICAILTKKIAVGIKKLFVKEKQPDLGYDENTPEHLVVLFQFIKKDKEDTLLFNTTFPDIIKTKDAEELATKIMSEQ